MAGRKKDDMPNLYQACQFPKRLRKPGNVPQVTPNVHYMPGSPFHSDFQIKRHNHTIIFSLIQTDELRNNNKKGNLLFWWLLFLQVSFFGAFLTPLSCHQEILHMACCREETHVRFAAAHGKSSINKSLENYHQMATSLCCQWTEKHVLVFMHLSWELQ